MQYVLVLKVWRNKELMGMVVVQKIELLAYLLLLSGFQSLQYTKNTLPPRSIQKGCWSSKRGMLGNWYGNKGHPIKLFLPGPMSM